MKRRAYLAALATAATGTAAGCMAVGDVRGGILEGDEYDVGMTRNEFVPDTYEISVGETVVWKNTSGALHTVTALENHIPDEAEYFASGGYESEAAAFEAWERNQGGFDTRETYEHTFEVPGEYYYVCIPHVVGGMDGTIVVTE